MKIIERIAYVLLIVGQIAIMLALSFTNFGDVVAFRKLLTTILSTILFAVVALFIELRRRGR